ncbi:MAG: tetratricopeptide repeat protein [Bacteroidetes bacterium]|nr:tetratricopeptide repeat protein [Bacteroidota bacterium]
MWIFKKTASLNFCSLLFLACCLLPTANSFSQSIEELEAKLKSASAEDKPGILNQLSEAYQKTNTDKSIDYAEQALKAARKLDDADGETGALINLGDAYTSKNNSKKAIQNYKEAIKIFDQYNTPVSSAYLWNKIADVYVSGQSYDDALAADAKALELFNKVKTKEGKEGMVNMNIEIGDIYFRQKKYENALPYYKQALSTYENSNDARGQATILEKIGTTYNNWGNYDEGYLFLNRAYELAKKNNLASIASRIEPNLEKAKNNRSKYEQNKSAFATKQEQETKQQINSLAAQNAKTLEEIEKLSYEQQASALKIKAQGDELKNKKLEAEIESRKNENLLKERELIDAQVKQQKLIIWGGIGFSALGLLLTLFVFNAYRNKKKANEVLRQKNDIIYKQKEQIEQKNILITDSIDYAKNIQEAILPPAGMLKKYFPQSFILYKPKDIVSGDFYWMHEEKTNGSFYIAAADCTGHGVPGAFMSLLGFIMLDEIVRTVHLTPAEILKEVNSQLMEMLHQNNENTTGKFGMDIALLKYDKEKKEIVFAGAHNPLIHLSNGQMNEVKANKISIGNNPHCTFENNFLQVREGDMVYIYSDGFQDQIGGEKRKKFLAFHLREFLQQIHSLEPEKQKAELKKKHNEWRGTTEQIDDILIIGLKI